MEWKFVSGALLFIPWFCLLCYYFLRGRRRRGAFRLGILRGSFGSGFFSKLSELPAVLEFLALLCLILALMRPQMVERYTRRQALGIDIMIALDTSDSMLIEDMRPGSRIVAAKKVVTQFVNALVSDRVGLITFAGETESRVPLTLDYSVLLSSLREVETSHYDPLLRPGTAIGVALASAVSRLRFSTAKSKVVIFLTDGENNTGMIDPETALDIVKHYNIKVYTIGVGADTGSNIKRIPRKIIDALGREKIIYQNIKSVINEKLLKKIAGTTGGLYFRAGNTKALEAIFSRIGDLEKTPVKALTEERVSELFPALLKLAVWLFGISLLLHLTVFWRTV